MKTLKYLFTIIILFAGIQTYAQTTQKKESFKVYGNCDMCKSRIEKAAKIDGVSKVEWNNKTKILTIVYDGKKAKSEDVQKKIAAAGHDTEKVKADNKVYDKLPECCKYRNN